VRRLVVLLVGYLATVAAATTGAVVGWGAAAVKAGRESYYYRPYFAGPVEPAPPHRDRVAWLGDSTIMDPNAYPMRAAALVEGMQAVLIALPGLDALAFYCGMQHTLDRLHPKAIAMVAHLGNIHRGFGAPVDDLVSELPLTELPTATLLPLHEFGLTVPKVLLFRIARWQWGEELLFFLDGIHRVVQDASWWDWAGPSKLPPLSDNLAELMAEVNQLFATPFGAGTAKVQILSAAVRLATRRGVPALVVVAPFPVSAARHAGLYDDAVFAGRIAALRRVIENAGGTLVDLHDAVGPDGFRDAVGHLNEHGHELVASRLREPLARITDTPIGHAAE
jgi:hypothetical protein